MAGHFGLWSGRRYFLNKMTLRELIVAYFTHHSILTYLVLIAGSIWLAVAHATGPWRPARRSRGDRPGLSAGRVSDAPLRAAFALSVPPSDDRGAVEAHPLRPPSEPERSVGAVRRAVHHAADHLRDRLAGRLADRRPAGRGGRVRDRADPVLPVRVLPLHPAPAVHAPLALAARAQAAPSRPSFPQRAGQLRHHQLHLGPDLRHPVPAPAGGQQKPDGAQSRLHRPRAEAYPWVAELSADDDTYAAARRRRAS